MSNERFTIRVEGLFESAHYIRNYLDDGSDEPLHGHSWKVEAFVSSTSINNTTGFAVDFYSVKKELDDICNYLDHVNLNDIDPFTTINPSTENIAKWIYHKLQDRLVKKKIKGHIEKIIVWEGPRNYAIYEKSTQYEEKRKKHEEF